MNSRLRIGPPLEVWAAKGSSAQEWSGVGGAGRAGAMSLQGRGARSQGLNSLGPDSTHHGEWSEDKGNSGVGGCCGGVPQVGRLLLVHNRLG